MTDTAHLEAEPGPLLEVVGVSKAYGNVQALKRCDIAIGKGSVHGLLGKNGAGKSTLVHIVAGNVRPDHGRVRFREVDITPHGRRKRQVLGISLLDQHPEVLSELSVAENLLLPEYPRRWGTVSWSSVWDRGATILAEYGVRLDPRMPCRSLGVSDRRRLAIVKALAQGGDLMMLDEPTAALTRSERSGFFEWIRGLNDLGKTFVFISHFTNDIRELCSEFTVLRDGGVVDSGESPRAQSAAELSARVTGLTVDEFHRGPYEAGRVLLQLRNFKMDDVAAVDMELHEGEIIGLAGLPGSGANKVMRALAGFESGVAGSVSLHGYELRDGRVAGRMDAGIAYLTADRYGEGIVPGFSVSESVVVGRWPRRYAGMVDKASIRKSFESMRERLSMAVRDECQAVSELSGGNQQKSLFARLLAASPSVLLLDEPTHGIDVGTKEEVHRLIDDVARTGAGVLVVAYDTEELVRLVDRVIVFRDGVVHEELAGTELTLDRVLDSIGGD